MVNANRLRDYENGRNIRAHYPQNGIEQLTENLDIQNQDNDMDDKTQQKNIEDDRNIQMPQNEEYFEIDKILRLRRKAGIREFFVKWADGSYSWEPENNMTERTLREYFSSHTQTGKIKRRFKSVLKQRK